VSRYKVCSSHQLMLAALSFAKPLLKAILIIRSTRQNLETNEDPANHLVVFRPSEHTNPPSCRTVPFYQSRLASRPIHCDACMNKICSSSEDCSSNIGNLKHGSPNGQEDQYSRGFLPACRQNNPAPAWSWNSSASRT
jgi:hypothetical protein